MKKSISVLLLLCMLVGMFGGVSAFAAEGETAENAELAELIEEPAVAEIIEEPAAEEIIEEPAAAEIVEEAVEETEAEAGETAPEEEAVPLAELAEAAADGESAEFAEEIADGASAPSGYKTDEHGILAYSTTKKYYGYDIQGYVGSSWRQVTFGYNGLAASVYNGSGISVSAPTFEFVADGQGLLLTYKLTNTSASTVSNYRFSISADTMVNGNDSSTNTVNDNVLTMSYNGVSFFGFSITEGATVIPTNYGTGFSRARNGDPSTAPVVTGYCDSAFVLYFDKATLAPGASAEYTFVVGMGDSTTINSIINAVKKAVMNTKTDFQNECLTNLDAGATYVITCGDETYIIVANQSGTIPLNGTDKDGKSYALIGKTISIVRKADGEDYTADSDPQEVVISDRPDAPDSPNAPVTVDKPEAVSADQVETDTNKLTVISPTVGQEYSIDKGAVWKKYTGTETIEFIGLTPDTEYSVITRVAATEEAFHSDNSDPCVVRTQVMLKNVTLNKTNYTGTYDGNPHTIELSVPNVPNVSIDYSKEESQNYGTSPVYFTDAGEHIVYYRISAEGYYPAYGCGTVTIAPATIVVNASAGGMSYTGSAQDVNVIVTPTTVANELATVKYYLDGAEASTASTVLPKVTNAGTYIVHYIASAANHSDATGIVIVFVDYDPDKVNSGDEDNIKQEIEDINNINRDNLTEEQENALDEKIEELNEMVDTIKETQEALEKAQGVAEGKNKDDIKAGDKETLKKAKDAAENIDRDHLTEEEKQALDNYIEELDEKVNRAEDVAQNTDAIEGLDSIGGKKLDTPEAVEEAAQMLAQMIDDLEAYNSGDEESGNKSIAEALGEDGYIEVELVKVTTVENAGESSMTFVFDVRAYQNGEQVHNLGKAVSFRLPVTESGYKYVNVYHKGVLFGQYEVTGNCVTLSSDAFSEYSYTLTNVKLVQNSGNGAPPSTGDNNALGLWLGLASMSVIAMGAVLTKKRKEN